MLDSCGSLPEILILAKPSDPCFFFFFDPCLTCTPDSVDRGYWIGVWELCYIP